MTTGTTPREKTADLHRAACIGDLATIHDRIAAGDAVDCRDPDGYTPFLLACKHAEPAVFHALLAAGADFEAVNARGMSGLFLVATTGVVSLARALIARGADVNRVGARGLTPLIAGLMSENPQMVRLLLASGADASYTDPDGNSAIKWARKFGSREMVELIREPDRAANAPPSPPMAADLHRAAATGDVELIHECLAASLPVDSLDADGFTPLMAATRQGKRAAIEALLKAGADPYRPSPGGMTPLLLAANNPVALLPFAAMGADLNHAGERRGFCPLIYAARQGFDDVVRFLVSAGSDLHRTDCDGLTALDHATRNGHRRIAGLLREALEAASPA